MFGSKRKNEAMPVDDVIEVVEGASDGAAATTRRGGLVGLITLPFRAVRAVVRTAVAIVVAVVTVLLFPFKVAWAISSRIVRAAADVVYGIWRALLALVMAVWAVIRFVFRMIDRTVGALIRLVLRVVLGILKLPLRAFRVGTKVGAAEASVKTAAAAASASAAAKLSDAASAPTGLGRFKRKNAA